MSSLAISLAAVQQATIRYGFPVILALGNFGNLLCIMIFSQKHLRQNSCSLYLLVAAISSLIGINWGIGTNTYALYQPPDPFTASLYLCRIRGYILQSSSLLYKTMILLACIDRFALTSTLASVRGLSKPNVAVKMIGVATLFTMLISIHLPILESIENNRCGTFGAYGFFFSIYLICIFGLILPILTISFSLLTLKNLKMARARIQPLHNTSNAPQATLTRRDMVLIRLALAEVLTGILLTSLYPINSFYTILATNVPNKSPDRIGIESFMSFLSLIVLFYLNYCVTFYLYVVISKAFREEIKRLIFKCIKRPPQEQTNTNTGTRMRRPKTEHI